MSVRIQLRLGTVIPTDEYLDVGEGVWDPENNRVGYGSGNSQPLYYPGLDGKNQDLILYQNSLIRSEYGGDDARFGWSGPNTFSMYTTSGLKIRVSNDYINFYARVNLNNGGTLSGDIDTAGGRFTDMNIRGITVSSLTDFIQIKDGDTGKTIGRIDERGVTAINLQQVFLILAANQESTNQLLRNLYSSGLISVRMSKNGKAFNNNTKVSGVGFSALNMHNHADWRGVAGMAELSVLVNGYHVQTRHADYRTLRPINDEINGTSIRAVNAGPAVPSSVLAKATGFTGQVLNSALANTQVEWMRNVYTTNPELCIFELSYLEAWVEKFDNQLLDVLATVEDINNLPQSLRKNFKQIFDFIQYYVHSGYKTPGENIPIPNGLVLTYDSVGHPTLGYVNYRISSVPVATMSNNQTTMTIQGVSYNLRALPINKAKAVAGIVDASNRFTLRRNLRERYIRSDSNGISVLDERSKLSWNTLYDSNNAMFDCADLELLCRMVPGFNGVNNDDFQMEDDANNVRVLTNRNMPVRYSPIDTVMGLGYYNNAYQHNTTDATGNKTQIKGFADLNLFTAKANDPKVVGGYTFMIPIELIVRTPRENWNPFNVAQQTTTTGNGSSSSPYSGWSNSGSFFTIPAEALTDLGVGKTNSDTKYKAYVSTPSGTKLMLANGIRIFDYDGYRRRFPIVPEATAFSAMGAELDWFKAAMKPLLKKIAGGNVVDTDIDDAF